MKKKTRYIKEDLKKYLGKKMIFIGGPRQVGKTTISKSISKDFKKSEYLNWDISEDRKKILNQKFDFNNELIIFDEIHKYDDWKNYLKGIFDKLGKKTKIIVTGSAKLNIYQKKGDSLLGRYFYYRLHPLSVAEISSKKNNTNIEKKLTFNNNFNKKIIEKLFNFGGFPEPYFSNDKNFSKIWKKTRKEQIISQDIRDLTKVDKIWKIERLAELLPTKIGSTLSIKSLASTLQTTFATVENWITILERVYYHFRIYPYQSTKFRALKKAPKLFLWDWTEVEDKGARFENMVAVHLLKFVNYIEDTQGLNIDLFYLRDNEKREADFLVTLNNKPWFIVETKFKKTSIDDSLKYFKQKLNVETFQVLYEDGIDKLDLKNDIRIISASKFLGGLV